MNQNILIYIFFSVAIFLLLREFWVWYFKINKLISILQKIEKHLNPEEDSLVNTKKENIICPECGHVNLQGANFCENCGAKL